MDATQVARSLLATARRRARLTQQQLGKAAGVSQPSIAAYETGRRQPTLPTLYRLLAAAGYEPRIELQRRAWTPLSAAETARRVRAALRDGHHSEALRWVAQLTADAERAPAEVRPELVEHRPPPTGDRRWDALLAGAVEHVCHRLGLAVPAWSVEPDRFLDRFWFVIETVLGRPSPPLAVSAFAETPAALANRGVFVHASSLESV